MDRCAETNLGSPIRFRTYDPQVNRKREVVSSHSTGVAMPTRACRLRFWTAFFTRPLPHAMRWRVFHAYLGLCTVRSRSIYMDRDSGDAYMDSDSGDMRVQCHALSIHQTAPSVDKI